MIQCNTWTTQQTTNLLDSSMPDQSGTACPAREVHHSPEVNTSTSAFVAASVQKNAASIRFLQHVNAVCFTDVNADRA